MKSLRFCFIQILFLSFTNVLIAQTNKSIPVKSSTLKSSGYAPVNGLKMYYEIHGEGKPLLLLHGAYMTIDMNWAALIPEWSKNYKVIAVEMQAHGRTADTDRELSYNALAEDAAALLKFLKIDSAAVAGYSLGGTVAFQLAIAHPELVTRVIAISTASKTNGWSKETNEAMKSVTPEFFDATPLKSIYENSAPDPKHWRAFVEKMVRFEKKDFDLGDANMQKLKMPVMLIMGDNDGVELQHVIDLYRWMGGGRLADISGFPKSRLCIIPGTGHVSVMMQTQQILDYTKPFLANLEPVAFPM